MVFRLSLAFVSLFVAWGIGWPATLTSTMHAVLGVTIHRFGWFYLLSMFGFLLFSVYLAFGRFAALRIGGEAAQPEFRRSSWFAMLFAAGMGIGLVFWGVAEPVSHFAAPPPGVEPLSADAANNGLRYAFFHWGLHPWAAYCVVALTLAFCGFNLKRPMLISATFEPLLGRHARGPLGHAIDVLALLATVFGVATSLGLGAMQIGAGLHSVFGLTNNALLQGAVIAVAAALYMISAASGLTRGIQLLSSANVVLAGALLAAVFVLGPTSFILDMLTNTFGDYLHNIVRMSMRLTPLSNGTWVADWTLFYFAWWMTWAPFVGMFIARISYGRTVREFVCGVLLAPAAVGFLWFATFGGAGLHAVLFDQVPLVATVKSDVSLALFSLLDTLPGAAVTSVAAIVLVAVFLITSADSATFVLGMMSSGGKASPSTRVKLTWGVVIAAIAAVLLASGGLQGLQTVSIIAALPFSVIMTLMCVCLYRMLKGEAAQTAARRRQRDVLLDQLLLQQPAPDTAANPLQSQRPSMRRGGKAG